MTKPSQSTGARCGFALGAKCGVSARNDVGDSRPEPKVSSHYGRGFKKISDGDVQTAVIANENGESVRSIARRLDTNHSALAKRMKAISAPGGYGEFDETDVAIILAVAGAGIPSGLTELARYMECSLLDLAEVCGAYQDKVAP